MREVVVHAPLLSDARRWRNVAQEKECTPLWLSRRSSVEKQTNPTLVGGNFGAFTLKWRKENAHPPLQVENFRVKCVVVALRALLEDFSMIWE